MVKKILKNKKSKALQAFLNERGKKFLKKKFDVSRLKEMRILLFLVVFIAVLTFIGYVLSGVVDKSPVEEDTFLIIRSVGGTTIELIESGRTPLDVLLDLHAIQMEELQYMVLVNCIDNICGGDDFYWAYYIDGKIGSVGVGEYIIQPGDDIEFRLVGKSS